MYIHADDFAKSLKENDKALTETAERNPEYGLTVDKFIANFKMLDKDARISPVRGVSLSEKKSRLVILNIGDHILPAFISGVGSYRTVIMPNIYFTVTIYQLMEMFDKNVCKTVKEALIFFGQNHLVATCKHCDEKADHGECSAKLNKSYVKGRINVRVYIPSSH